MKRAAFIASLWSGGELIARQGLQVATTLVLARLLAPADFGVIAMLTLFTGLAAILADGGFSTALIQRQDVDEADKSTVFWTNLGIGTALSCVLVLLAPVIADLYGVPQLKQLMWFMGWAPLLSSTSAVHFALLTKRLDFRTQAKAGGIGATVSAALAILVAMRGGGVWALVTQSLVMTGITSSMLWLLHPWRPRHTLSSNSFRKLAGFGGYVLASSALETLYSRLYALLLARRFGPAEVGLYANAENARGLPLNLLGSLLTRIGLPLLSATRANTALQLRGFVFASRISMLANTVFMLVPIAFPEQVLMLLFGPQWLPAAPVLQILALAGLLHPLHVLNLQLLLSAGMSVTYFRYEILKKVIGIALLVTGAWYGPVGLAWSQVALTIVAFLINAARTQNLIGCGAGQQLADVWPLLLAVGVAWGCSTALDSHDPGWTVNLAVRSAGAAAAFLIILAVLWRPQLVDLVRGSAQVLKRDDKVAGHA